MTTHKTGIAVLTNGHIVQFRHLHKVGGWVRGIVQWDGNFIAIVNVADYRFDADPR